MKINTGQGEQLLYKSAVVNARDNMRVAVKEALSKEPQNKVIDTFGKYTYKGSVFDKEF